MPKVFRKTLACFVAILLFVSSFALAQNSSDQTRPRRAETQTQTATPSSSQIPDASAEPLIRIGLSTDARSVSITTSGRLMYALSETAQPEPLQIARVRLEARALSPDFPQPSPDANYHVEIAGAATRIDAERAATEIKSATNEDAQISQDARTNTWRIQVGQNGTRNEAEDLRSRLQDAGFVNAAVVQTGSIGHPPATAGGTDTSASMNTRGSGAQPSPSASPAQTARSSTLPRSANAGGMVRPVTRASVPTRELVAFSTAAATLFRARAPVQFSSDNEQSAPVRFNEKPYRGRLEVFANERGTLTVVNVIPLEAYVRGVVPNELSPGGYPALEALKAQAIAARTYAVKNRGQFASQGFDLLPTTRSQVYGGMSTEHPLTDFAVESTRGLIATYNGEPINALYTSTCGGRTEDVENIFNEATPYLRGRECAAEGRAAFAPFTIKSSRDTADIREEQNAQLARDAALLAVHSFQIPPRITDAWLTAPVTQTEARGWLQNVARLSRQNALVTNDDITHAPAFSSALMLAVFGETRADTLLNSADVEYLLSFRDATDVPQQNRADVAMLLRDGFLALYPDATLRPREPLTRARCIRTIVLIMESRGNFQLQKGTTRPASNGALIVRSARNHDQPIQVSSDAYLFRSFGDNSYPARSVVIVGGEPVTFHVNAVGDVDFLEVRPAPNGAAADHYSPFSNWTVQMSVAEAQQRLRQVNGIFGNLRDLHVAARGSSRRAIDLEIIGTNGTAHLRGGRIRSILGLREQLFVIDRRYDDAGHIIGFTFIGRGWGHGVGMCQVGAFGLARIGWTYDRILKNYYTGIELTKLY
ncbi:MAG: hypothetical protein AUG51_07865 [Acidobacteria bacterium 13_1_20CM_3_53_8]|nr:MAG: hypothetical protein AUG51_07865 [Acidobacteria bacterium 13_1_20CM_3_53_8]